MHENPTQQHKSLLSRISEDWWAVMVGFALIALVYLRLLVKVPW